MDTWTSKIHARRAERKGIFFCPQNGTNACLMCSSFVTKQVIVLSLERQPIFEVVYEAKFLTHFN